MHLLIDKIGAFLSRLEDRPLLAMTLLIGFSLLIKAFVIFQADIINTDGVRYLNSAHELFQGHVDKAFAHEKMLGFTFLLGLTHQLIPDWFLAGKILSCVALILTTIPLYLITQELFGRRAALLTALVFTVAPSINGKCNDVIKDPTFLFLMVLSLWFVIYATKTLRWGYALTAGFLCCLSVLVRPEGVIFFLVITLFLLLSLLFLAESRRPFLQCLVAFCLLPFGTLLTAAILFAVGVVPPELLPKIYAKFALYLQSDLLQIYRNIYQHLKDVEENFFGGQWTNDFFEYARYNIFLIYLIGLLQTFSKTLFPVFVVPLCYGLNLKKHWNRNMVLFLSVCGCFFLIDYVYLVSRNFLSARYLLVLVVLSFVLVGYGLDRLISSVRVLPRRRMVFSVMILLCLVWPLGETLSKGMDEKMELKTAGVWLRNHKDLQNERIIVNEERIAYYAGLLRGDYDTFNGQSEKEFEQKALRKGCAIMVIYMGRKDLETPPEFKEYSLVEKIQGAKKIAMIYERKA